VPWNTFSCAEQLAAFHFLTIDAIGFAEASGAVTHRVERVIEPSRKNILPLDHPILQNYSPTSNPRWLAPKNRNTSHMARTQHQGNASKH
jgi:hypothetical protein